VADFEWAGSFAITTEAVTAVINAIADDVRTNVDGKTVYIPGNIHYALPATEKQFTGHLPTGTYVSVPENLLVGIHWTNTDKNRIDLDLSMIDASGKIGWDGEYRTGGRGIMFSGDITDAPKPKGASELFYIRKGEPMSKILSVNYFNFDAEDPVPCKIIAAQHRVKSLRENYMVNPNHIVASANITISKKQNVLGLVTNVDGENRVYFANVNIGGGISASVGVNSERTRQYYVASLINSLGLRDVLVKAGANVVDEKPEGDFVDLSPEALDKTTITKLMKPRLRKEAAIA